MAKTRIEEDKSTPGSDLAALVNRWSACDVNRVYNYRVTKLGDVFHLVLAGYDEDDRCDGWVELGIAALDETVLRRQLELAFERPVLVVEEQE